MAANVRKINAARPQYEAQMIDNAHSQIRSTQPELPQRVAFNFFVIGSAVKLAKSIL